MSNHNPMVMLRNRAEEHLLATTQALGKVQQNLQHAKVQHQQLQDYQQEYQLSLRQGMTGCGMPMAHLVNHHAFLVSLNQVVMQHEMQINRCEQDVDRAKKRWVVDKQRLNALEMLLERRRGTQRLQEMRREQKLMDECAQRIGHRRAHA